MKTFTVRDLDRSPAKVLAAADRDGMAKVRSRNGLLYAVTPYRPTQKKQGWAEFARERREAIAKLSMPRISRTQAAELDRLIAGE